jgi:hypothetical protein
VGDPDRGVLGRLTDGWTILGLLGALLGLSLLFVHLPASLWAGNTGEFHWGFTAFLRPGLGALAAGLLVSLVVLVLLPRRGRAVLASLLCAASLVAWLYAFFLAGNMTVLNGIDPPMDFDTPIGVWELAFVGVMWLMVAGAIAQARRTAIVGLIVLNLGLVVATVTTVRAAPKHRMRAPPAQATGPVFRFSTRDNVLVVLLDGLQSDVAEAVLHKDRRLRAAFDGFRLYRDTLGVAPTTYVSMPAIHSGADFSGHTLVGAYFEESIHLRSFMTRFAKAGYDTTLLNPIEGVCPDRVRTCMSSAQILRSGDVQRQRESLRLFDVSLFRLAPVWVKQRIYDNGNWFMAGRFGMAEEAGRIFEHNLLLGEMARRLSVTDGPPTLKFVHSLATHTPFILTDDCRTPADTSWALMAPQARCALRAVAGLLEALKTAKVYDCTEVAVVADHGIGEVNSYIRSRAGSRQDWEQWARRAGSANPVFLLKRRHAHGELAIDETSVYLPDLGATLCASSGACTAPGVPVGQAPAGRVRRYVDYEWKHEFWHLRTIPQMTAYDVRGPVWEAEAWERVDGESGSRNAKSKSKSKSK